MGKRRTDDSFPFLVDDWLSSLFVRSLTQAEEAGFLKLLLWQWKDPDGGLPDDDKALADLSGLKEDWFKGSGQKLKAKFPPHPEAPGKIANPKQFGIWKERRDRSLKQAQGANKTNLKRWGGGRTSISPQGAPYAFDDDEKAEPVVSPVSGIASGSPSVSLAESLSDTLTESPTDENNRLAGRLPIAERYAYRVAERVAKRVATLESNIVFAVDKQLISEKRVEESDTCAGRLAIRLPSLISMSLKNKEEEEEKEKETKEKEFLEPGEVAVFEVPFAGGPVEVSAPGDADEDRGEDGLTAKGRRMKKLERETREVFERWKKRWSPKAALDSERKKWIHKGLKEYGKSVEDLGEAIEGVAFEPFNMGDPKVNDRGKRYVEPRHIFKSAAHVENFQQLYRQHAAAIERAAAEKRKREEQAKAEAAVEAKRRAEEAQKTPEQLAQEREAFRLARAKEMLEINPSLLTPEHKEILKKHGLM